MKTIYSDAHRLHGPRSNSVAADFVPGFEMPRRAEIVLARVEGGEARPVILPPQPLGRSAAGACTTPALSTSSDDRHAEWRKRLWRQRRDSRHLDRARPCAASCRTASAPASATTASTPSPRITAGSWRRPAPPSMWRSPRSAWSPQGEPAAFALCRPPGHHAGQRLLRRLLLPQQRRHRRAGFHRRRRASASPSSTSTSTTATARRRSSTGAATCCSARCTAIPRTSIPISPASPTNAAKAPARASTQLSAAPRRGLGAYRPRSATPSQRIAAFAPDALVISLGVDTFENDPISRFKLKSEDYLRIGELIAGRGARLSSSWRAAMRSRRSASTPSTY